jgi:tungstate transport system permease protein
MLDAIDRAIVLLCNGDPALWQTIWISLKTCLLALLLATPLALAGGVALARYRFAGRRVLIWLAQAALSLPTVLVGLLLYLLLSRQGLLGGLHWLFSQPGLVAGQVLIALPLLLALTLAAVQAADPRLLETAVTLGASPLRQMWTVLREVRFGVTAAIVSGFGRVISEVGCAMMVGGNIAGDTRTITTAIALETSKGDFAFGIALGLVLMAIALLINGALLLLQGEARGAQ